MVFHYEWLITGLLHIIMGHHFRIGILRTSSYGETKLILELETLSHTIQVFLWLQGSE